MLWVNLPLRPLHFSFTSHFTCLWNGNLGKIIIIYNFKKVRFTFLKLKLTFFKVSLTFSVSNCDYRAEVRDECQVKGFNVIFKYN